MIIQGSLTKCPLFIFWENKSWNHWQPGFLSINGPSLKQKHHSWCRIWWRCHLNVGSCTEQLHPKIFQIKFSTKNGIRIEECKCGFWSTRILPYLPLSGHLSFRQRRDITHIIWEFRLKEPYIFWKPITLAIQYSTVQHSTAKYSPVQSITVQCSPAQSEYSRV